MSRIPSIFFFKNSRQRLLGYFFLVVFAATGTLYSSTGFCEQPPKKPLKGKNILFVIAHKDFRDEEYEVPRNILERIGANVVVASSDTGIAIGMRGLKVLPDILISDPELVSGDSMAFDAIVFVGGLGAQKYYENEDAHLLAKLAAKSDKVIGAICVAPVILAKAGVLRWKEATVWPSSTTKHILKQEKVKYVEKSVVTDGKIVTADGPVASKEFGEELVRLLLKQDESSSSKSKGGGMQDK